MIYTLPAALTVHDITNIGDGAMVRVDPVARAEIARFHDIANSIANDQTIYGRSTGVGANRSTESAQNSAEHGMNLLRSHAVDAGPVIEATTTRAMLAVRLNQLLQPGSGIEPRIIDALERMLAENQLPEVRKYGGIGTADLPALAGTALALTGERSTSGGRFEPIGPFHADSALPFMSSSALTIAASARSAARLGQLVDAVLSTFALSAAAICANTEAFSTAAAIAIGSPHSLANAERLLAIIGDTEWQPLRVQDPFAFRGLLPSLSVLSCAIQRLSEATENLTSRAQENPLFLENPNRVVHHGAFLENWLAHELDATAIALAQFAPQILARIRFLNDDSISDLPRFLAPRLGGSSGTMIIEYVAASALGDVLARSAPVSTHTAVLSCGVEEDATFATSARTKLDQSIDAFETLIACEVVTSVRALRLGDRLPARLSPALAELLTAAECLPSDMHDRDLRGDLELGRDLIASFASAANRQQATAH